MEGNLFILIVLVSLGLAFLVSSARILPEYQRGVILRLGRAVGVRGPGLFFIIPLVDRMYPVSIRTIVLDIPPQDIITKDNVTITVNAVNYFRVVDPLKALVAVEDYMYATSQLAQTTLRSVVGQVELDQVLSDRDTINHQLRSILDTQTESWGIKVSNVELKDVNLPKDMQKIIGRQAEAERDRRAKVIMAEAEEMAAQHLLNAASLISKDPMAIQIRFLQTIKELPAGNSILVLPIPVDLISGMLKSIGKKHDA
ncbi:MAG: slipin family protein [Deltaproteobacteria bacterium]|nr:slipin family protein [Deltaproteobacteria bacterium]